MGDETKPKRASWLAAVKSTGQLTLYLDSSLDKNGWVKVFRDAITAFNDLSAQHKLGVTVKEEQAKTAAQVEARASDGDIDFHWPPDLPQETIRFNGRSVHGFCRAAMTQEADQARALQWRVKKCFIYVPGSPSGVAGNRERIVGDGVKLVIAVHELLHAAGLVHNDEHSTDDIFCWPSSTQMGDRPEDDVLIGKGVPTIYKVEGRPARTLFLPLKMPPLVLQPATADKIRKLWA